MPSVQELEQTFTDFEDKWFFGLESEPGWAAAIRRNVPNLFSLYKEPGSVVANSRMLRVRDIGIRVMGVNFEVRGLRNDIEGAQ